MDAAELEALVREHDRAAESVAVWLGAEPTFTDRCSESPEWLCEALGSDKEERARALASRLLERTPGAVVLRPLGRQYASEPRPRWCYGIYSRRDGSSVWSGPPDRFDDGEPNVGGQALVARLRSALLEALREAGWSASSVWSAPPTREMYAPLRLACRADGRAAPIDPKLDVRLARGSLHATGHVTAPVDSLAAEGTYLVLLHAGAGGHEHNAAWIELPAFAQPRDFLTFLGALGAAARHADVPALGLRGFLPPVDDSVALTTLTPDPAVLEVNQAPEPDVARFHRATRTLFELAADVGLAPYRLHYNGAVSDSGGGGQLTFGGPSPAESPFFKHPALLPRLIRYLICHPSLSYWFATQYVGGSSQSPRPDEGVRESFLELEIALEQLAAVQAPRPETLWATLRHFLADASGNPHRSELNIEKLFNRFLPGRGCLGLVEFRALSMPPSPDVAVARAMLLRSLIVMLSREDQVPRLVHWGDELHDRFALPSYLREDLREVFADLRAAGLGLGAEVEALLSAKEAVVLGSVECRGHRVTVEQALEFWPLVGDVASQEGGGSRLVDASTSRLEVRVDAPAGGACDLTLQIKGHRVPLRSEQRGGRLVCSMGLRYRSFVPWSGLHPTLGAEKTVTLTLRHPSGEAVDITIHPWRPDGEAYPGLPVDLEAAAARREERFVVKWRPPAEHEALPAVPSHARTQYCVDLRRLQPPSRHH